jgi:ribosomal protein S18 acetylase RimI-like enzyme
MSSADGSPASSIVRPLEELSLNAWPALQTLIYDGWLLRFAAGYTKRANSINPLYVSSLPMAEKVDYCESLYAQRYGLDVVFKITQATRPSELDTLLAKRDYRRIDETSLQILDLSALSLPVTKSPKSLTDHGINPLKVVMSPTLTVGWSNAYARLSGLAERHIPTMEKMLGSFTAATPVCFLALKQSDGKTVAVGLAVAERGHVGLFDITVAAPLRGQGIGTRLMTDLLRWGKERGAHTAYLQVVKTNEAALRLYGKLGFWERYLYWYRVKACRVFQRPFDDGEGDALR